MLYCPQGDPRATSDNDTSSVGVVLLTVLNSTASDSGYFACVADNGVGGVVATNTTILLVRRKAIFFYRETRIVGKLTPIIRDRL